MYVKKFLILCFIVLSTCTRAETTLIIPQNGIVTENNQIVFKWNPSENTTSYQLQIAQDTSFNIQIVNQYISGISFAFNLPDVSGTYYWRVRAKNLLDWTKYNTFTILKITNIPSIKTWFRSDSNLVTSSGNVSSWTDISSGNIASEPSSSLQPVYLASDPLINNKPALIFNPTGSTFNSLRFANNITVNNYSVFIIRTYEPTPQYAAQYVLGASGYGLFAETSILNWGFGQNYISGGYQYILKEVNSIGAYSIYYHENDSLRKNGISQSYLHSGPIPTLTLQTIGKRSDNDYPYKGKIAEILISNTSLNNDTIVQIEQYLRNKYSPLLSLGNDTIAGNAFCDSIVITAPSRYKSYLWSTGDTTSSIKVKTNGRYTLLVKDNFDYVYSDDIVVLPYKRFNNSVFSLCENDSITISTHLDNTFNHVWSSGSLANSIVVKQPGRYTLSITDKNGCVYNDTIYVSTVSVKINPILVSNNLTLCEGEKLFISSNTPIDSIRWSTGSNALFISIISPGNYTVYAATTTGCVLNQSFNINIAGTAPVANFNYMNVCQNSETVFTDSSTTASGSTITNWKWTFGDGNSTTGSTVNNVYANLGNYTVGYKITTNQGCSDSIAKTIIVNRNPVAFFYNLLSCSGNPTTFVDQTVANAASVTDWTWDFNGLDVVNGIQNPYFRFPTDGTYSVTLKATNSNGCSDTITLPTTVNASPVSNFSFDSVCGKTPVSFKFLASVASPSFIPDISWGSWDFGDGNIETAIRNPQHIYQTPGTYDVSLFVRSSDQCVDTVTKRIKVFDFPIVDFTVSQTQCTGKEIQFTDISATPDGTPLTKWNWFFSGQSTSEAQNPRYTFNEQGNYTVQLTARNAVGCTGTKLRSVAISAPPTPAFTFSPQNGLPPLTVNYFNQSPVNGNYLWDYGDGSPLVEGYNPPVHIYTEKGTFPIKLIATDFRGCTDTLTKLILVDKAFLDGVMASVSIIPNGEFYKIQVSVINNSNVEITALGLSLQLGGGAVIRENWTGSLLPGQTTVYLFTGEIKIGDNGQIPVICASIDNINNNAAEDRTDNNTSCKEVAVGSFDVLSVYPNPAYEVINFGVMLPKEGRVNIRFIDILGQQMYSKDFDGLKGYNSLSISTMQLNAAVYVAEVSYDGQVVRKKFMRKDRK
jgi:PKD repeat protein